MLTFLMHLALSLLNGLLCAGIVALLQPGAPCVLLVGIAGFVAALLALGAGRTGRA